jgi:hypothetical protein
MALVLLALLSYGGVTRTRAQISPVLLVPGWNNFAYPGPAQPVLAALGGIAGQYDALWHFDAGTQAWKSFNPRTPETSDFVDFAQGNAYWIHMVQGAVLQVGQAGTVPNASPPVALGWNNVAQLTATAPVPDALAPYKATFAVVWHWNAGVQRWEMFDPTSPSISDFTSLVQGQAYFVEFVSIAPVAPVPTTGPCYSFQTYQPQVAEVQEALNRAGQNSLMDDPSYRLADLHTALDTGPATAPAYIPPTLLKSIAWLESGWRQATFSISRGNRGATITSRTCAYGLMQVLTGMDVKGTPTDRQNLIGTNYLHNVAAGTQILVEKWNRAPANLPIYGRRDPQIIEDWYFPVWAYHCFGDVCARYSVHNNPDDPSLKWPRPMYGSSVQKNSGGTFSVTDYPYQEIIFGQIANPPVVDGAPLWQAIPVLLPPHGSVGFPTPKNTIEASAHLDNGQALPVPTPAPTVAPTPAPGAAPQPGPTPVPLSVGP